MDTIYQNIGWITYALTRVDAFKYTLTFLSVIFIFLFVISVIFQVLYVSDYSGGLKEAKERLNLAWPARKKFTFFFAFMAFFSLFANCLIPNKKDIALIAGVTIGAYATKAVIESPITKKAMGLLEAKIDEAMQETQAEIDKVKKSTSGK